MLAIHIDLGLHPMVLTQGEGSDPRNGKYNVVQSVVSAGTFLRAPQKGNDLNEPGTSCSGVSGQAEALYRRGWRGVTLGSRELTSDATAWGWLMGRLH